MKRNLTFLLGLFLAAGLQFTAIQNSFGQGTQNDNFIFQVTTAAGTQDYYKGDCGWQYSLFGGNVPEEICNDIIWAYDITPDSVMCDTATMNLQGKWALIRRGTCNFSIKAFYAQQAGASGVIIVNHYSGATDNGCSVIGMAAGTFADLVTIPCIFVCRNVGEFIDEGIKSGGAAGCFLFPRVNDAAAAYHYATPLDQVDTLDHIGMRFYNREPDVLNNITLTAVVDEPGGNQTTLTATIAEAPNDGTDVFTYFPAYLPPAVKGKFKVTYSNDYYTESRDTLVRYFEHTDHTFATDNLVIDPGGISNDASFVAANFFCQSAAMCLTGDAGGTATYASFGLANAADIHVPGGTSGENDIAVYLYDADSNDDGTWEILNDGTGTFDDLAAGLVGYAVYTVNGTEVPDAIIDVQLDDLQNPGTYKIDLKPNHPYYISLAYDGIPSGLGIMPRFSNSLDQYYLNFPTTPLYLGQMFTGGWSGAIVIQRLHL
ncbi:MAG: PA domain-containing protein, partial [Saprospiraceae bacterium]